MRLPIKFVEKMKFILGDEIDSFLAEYEKSRLYGLRVNTDKISVGEFVKICPFDIEPVPWIENGFYYDGDKYRASSHPYYYAGLYYLQEPSAMTPGDRLPIDPGDRVLDICAAPGGKTTQLAVKLHGSGAVFANDISASRTGGLIKNIEIFGIGNAVVLCEKPAGLVGTFREYFDKILVDAPCSGEGMFRKDKRMPKAWEEHGPEYFTGIQRSVLLSAADMLKPGGLMMYSTCTFDPRENEGAVEYLLSRRDDFEVADIGPYAGFDRGRPEFTKSGLPDIEKTVRIWPHKMRGEGHYLALLRKKGSDGGKEPGVKRRGRKKIPGEITDFFNQVSKEMDKSRFETHGAAAYYVPDGIPDLSGLRVLRRGLFLGELKANRFEPSQSLAMYLGKDGYLDVTDFDVTDGRVIRYLKGETLDISDLAPGDTKRTRLVCVGGYPLGWGKSSKGTLKNGYLPGWRMQ